MKIHRLSLPVTVSLVGLIGVLGLSGCSSNFGDSANVASQTAMSIKGIVHGGQQGLVGAHVYMFAAGVDTYGEASTSLLTAGPTTSSDGTNFFTTTDGGGNFNIGGEFTCTANTNVYLYATGGDPGVGTGDNAGSGLLAAVGECGAGNTFPSTVTNIYMNEASTIAAAYALAGYTTDPMHISAPTAHSTQAQTGVTNAFNNAVNLVVQATGAVPAKTTAGNGTVPQVELNTLADILAGCINSTGPTSSGCATLFANAPNTAGVLPTNTAQAAINIAQHPGAHVSALLNLATNAGPFQPFETSATDFSVGIVYTDPTISAPRTIAIDAVGNAWITNANSNVVTELSSTGKVLSGTTGFGKGGLFSPSGIAIDATTGTAWVTNLSTPGLLQPNHVRTLNSSGALSGDFSGSSINLPDTVSVDGQGNAWLPNTGGLGGAVISSITEITRAGTIPSGAAGYTVGLLNQPIGSAIDASGNLWTVSSLVASVIKMNGANTPTTGGFQIFALSGGILGGTGLAIDNGGNIWAASTGVAGLLGGINKVTTTGTVTSVAPYQGPLLTTPTGIALDSAGHAWAVNNSTNALVELNNDGSLAASNGFSIPSTAGSFSIALDSSGDIWIPNSSGSGTSVTEIIGLAAPVVTPLAGNLIAPYGNPASRP
jgi:streptogramin lyase